MIRPTARLAIKLNGHQHGTSIRTTTPVLSATRLTAGSSTPPLRRTPANSATHLHSNFTCAPCNTAAAYFSKLETGVLRCYACDASCATCNDSSSTSCSTCPAGKYLWPDYSCRPCTSTETAVVDSVTVKVFIESTTLCRPCSSNCDACLTSSTHCTSCRAGDLLFLNNTCGFCNTTNGFYVDGTTCKPCDPTCKSCLGPAQTQCTTCLTPYGGNNHYLHTNFTCGVCNPLGYFIQDTECKACDPTCTTCTGADPKECKSCHSGDYLYDTNSSCANCNNTGIFTNATDFYHHFINQTRCSLCTVDCLQCLNSTACVTCRGGLYKYVGNLSCDDCTEAKVWRDGSQMLCRDCHSTCLRCNGSGETQCTECDTSINLYLHENNTCAVCDLLKGKYITEDGKCKSCHISCQTCTGNLETQCTSCNLTHAANNFVHTSNSTCGPCIYPSGYWIDGTNCTVCHPECKTCLAGTNTSCTSCNLNSPAHKYLSLDNNTCSSCGPQESISIPAVSIYPLFHITNETNVTHPLCLRCSPTCRTCLNSPDYCLDCNPFWLMKDGLNQCSMCDEDRFYPNFTAMRCIPCHPKCLRCDGPEEKNCTKCDLLLFLHTNRSCDQCETSNGKFIQTHLGVQYCKDCHATCATCSGPSADHCKSCPQGLYLGVNGTCTACDGDGVFIQNNLFCRYCRSFCKRCGPLANKCTSCWPQDFMYPDSTCGPCDTPRFYQSLSSGTPRCEPCHPTCLTCLNSSAEACRTCDKTLPDPFYLFQNNNTCSSCASERFFVQQTTYCSPCDPTCLTCFGSTDHQCISCSFPRVLREQSKCIIEEITITKTSFNSYTRSIEIEFSEPISLHNLKLFSETSTAFIYESSHNKSKLEELLHQEKFSEARDSLRRFEPVSITTLEVKDNLMNVSITSKKSIDKAIFLLVMKEKFLLRGKTNKDAVFTKQFILYPDLNFVTSEFDNQVSSIKGGMTAGVGMASTLVTVVSLPQALILFKVFQTLDIYIFVDVEYPKNFEAFFTIISRTIIDFIPGIYDFLTDEEGTALPKRFSHFGYKVHILKNLGPVLSIFTVIFMVQIITFFLKRFKIRFIGKYIQSKFSSPRNL